MKPKELKRARRRLDRFLKDLLRHLGRSERRRWGAQYIQGLLLDGERKSVVPIASRFVDGNAQAIQQLLHSSPWDPIPIRQAMTQKVIAELKPVEASIIDDTGFPKKGEHSVGVARQYSGTLGKVDNCQVAVSLNYATHQDSFPMDWELYLPESWTDDPQRREKTRIPKEVKFRHKWQIALELIDRAIDSGTPLGVIVADSAYGKVTEFRDGLSFRGLLYAVGIEGTMVFWRRPTTRRPVEYKGRGRPPLRPHYDPKDLPETACQIAESIPEDLWTEIVYGEGTKGPLKGYFTALRVQPAHGHKNHEPEREMVWLLIERTTGKDKPYKYFLLNLDETTPLSRLVRITKLRWRVEMDYQILKGEVGLDHYEGRSWPGWNHHVTLVSLAYAFLLLERLRGGSFFPSVPTDYKETTPESYLG
jgi:SRSO17 transposase